MILISHIRSSFHINTHEKINFKSLLVIVLFKQIVKNAILHKFFVALLVLIKKKS